MPLAAGGESAPPRHRGERGVTLAPSWLPRLHECPVPHRWLKQGLRRSLAELARLLLLLCFVQPRAEHLERLCLVLVLRPLVLR